jgi:hypothetical protein
MKRLALLAASVCAALVLAAPVTAATPTTIVQQITDFTVLSGCGDLIFATISGTQVLHFQPLANGGFMEANQFTGSLSGGSVITGISWTSNQIFTGGTLIVPPGSLGAVSTSIFRIRIDSSTGLTRFLNLTVHTTVKPNGETAVSFSTGGWQCG